MSEITDIEVQQKDKTRANLYLDGEFFTGISIELCMKYHLKKGKEIDKQELQSLVFEDEKGKALSKAVKYTSSTLKTKKQIKDFLKKKEYIDEVVDYVISKMEEYRYLDDSAYAKAYIATYSNKYGKLKLKAQLKSRGVSESILDKVFEEDIKNENSLERVAEKYLKNKELTRENLIKLSRFLYSRGYEYDEINSYTNRLKND